MTLVMLWSAGCGIVDRTPDPGPAAQRFAAALRRGVVAADALTRRHDAPAAQRLLDELTDELGVAPQIPLIGPVVASRDAADTDGDLTASVRMRLRWRLLTGTWVYDTRVPLRLVAGAWRVRWQPTILHPRLGDGRSLRLQTSAPDRGPILSDDGEPLFTDHLVVTVYVQPRRMRDLDRVIGVLQRVLGIAPTPLRDRVRTAAPNDLLEVVTLRMEDYTPLRTTLRPVPGLVFRRGHQLLTPTRRFGRALLGRVGPPTAEVLAEAPAGFGTGDPLGLSGLQRRFQAPLAGIPALRVDIVDADGGRVATVHRTRAVDGEALRTTLDIAVQRAAERALAPVRRPAALVALRASTGEVLAVANGPDGGAEDLALTGRYPPGSSFKIVSAAALLTSGMTPRAPVDCPGATVIDGRRITNAGEHAVGRTTLAGAFTASCNTTFAQMASRLPDGAVRAAARSLGFGGAWDPGVPAFTGQVPGPRDRVERAATMFGQARVLASPLLMAAVAGAIQDGTWHPPILLPDHADPGTTPAPLAVTVPPALRRMLRRAVTDGTARGLAGAGGPPVRAKTGTAEIGRGDAPDTHAWTVAARGDLAVAVVVDRGGTGSDVAVPVVRRFLAAVPTTDGR